MLVDYPFALLFFHIHELLDQHLPDHLTISTNISIRLSASHDQFQLKLDLTRLCCGCHHVFYKSKAALCFLQIHQLPLSAD